MSKPTNQWPNRSIISLQNSPSSGRVVTAFGHYTFWDHIAANPTWTLWPFQPVRLAMHSCRPCFWSIRCPTRPTQSCCPTPYWTVHSLLPNFHRPNRPKYLAAICPSVQANVRRLRHAICPSSQRPTARPLRHLRLFGFVVDCDSWLNEAAVKGGGQKASHRRHRPIRPPFGRLFCISCDRMHVFVLCTVAIVPWLLALLGTNSVQKKKSINHLRSIDGRKWFHHLSSYSAGNTWFKNWWWLVSMVRRTQRGSLLPVDFLYLIKLSACALWPIKLLFNLLFTSTVCQRTHTHTSAHIREADCSEICSELVCGYDNFFEPSILGKRSNLLGSTKNMFPIEKKSINRVTLKCA